MAEASSLQPTTSSQVETVESVPPKSPTVKLKLQKPQNDKKVKWEEGTVDNEHMNKKKSKCCCVYEKPRVFGESSDESGDDDDDCTNHCKGHKNKCYQQQSDDTGESSHQHSTDGSGASSG